MAGTKRGQKTLDDSFAHKPAAKKARFDKSDDDVNGDNASRASNETSPPPQPSSNTEAYILELPGKIATFDAAAAVDANPPLGQLMELVEDVYETQKGEAAVYWMRMEDLRVEDNRALQHASQYAVKHSIPLVALFVISPGDYKSHDRSPRRIDFMLRNLKLIQSELDKLNIPLHIITEKSRKKIPSVVVDLLKEWKATNVFANVEYEVDELRRDIEVCKLSKENDILASLVHDKLVVEPGKLETGQGKQYAVFSPWLKKWNEYVKLHSHTLKEAEKPKANDKSVRNHATLKDLFGSKVPDSVSGFECADADKMDELWPAGNEAAHKVFERFLDTKPRTSQVGDKHPLAKGAEKASGKGGRIDRYKDDRARCDIDSSSRMSPYLASGVISARALIRSALAHGGYKQINSDRTTAVGSYISEVAWRDFYTHVMAAWPRVSMGRPYLEKFADVEWEKDGAMLQAWKEGRTGVPIVDAAMRQAVTQGWMHNRARMIAAMYLTKDLMIDWRLGEQFFMQNFIDGDLASNNGGWQWSASTGTDPQPYFRIFNPYAQAEKADPTGDYIRHFVPELKDLKGKALYDPSTLDSGAFKKLGYPKPIVDHKVSRERALRRYKNPGEK